MEDGSQCSTSERRKQLWTTPASFSAFSLPLAALCSPQETDILICLHGEICPRKKKEKIAIVPLCRNIGEIIALNGIIFLLKGLWAGFSDHWFVGAMVAWMIIAGFDVWYIEKSQRYRKK